MTMRIHIERFLVAPVTLALIWGCGYYLVPGHFKPFNAKQQPEPGAAAAIQVYDDGTAAYIRGRLEVSVRPMTDDELNRQFISFSKDGGGPGGELPTIPMTFGDWEDPQTGGPPLRFSVFKVSVKNYEYPKVKLDPLQATIESDNGRTYYPWGDFDIVEYFRRFAVGYTGLAYQRFTERRDIVTRTSYPAEEFVFSGQLVEGFILFPQIHNDVRVITFRLPGVGTRYDFRDEPLESLDLRFRFERDVRKVKSYDELASEK